MSQERVELEILKKRQNYLETQLAVLARDIQRLENRLQAERDTAYLSASIEPGANSWSSSSAVIPKEATPPLPPPIPPVVELSSSQAQASSEIAVPELAFIPPVIPAPTDEPIPEFESISAAGAEAFPPAAPTVEHETAPAKGSFEMRVGTYWFVRIGIVMLLTALPEFHRQIWSRRESCFALFCQRRLAGDRRLAATKEGKGSAEKFWAGVARWRSCRSLLHDLRRPLLHGRQDYRKSGVGGCAADGLGRFHRLAGGLEEIRSAGIIRGGAGLLYVDHQPD